MKIIDEYFDELLLNNPKSNEVYRSHINKYFKVIKKDINLYFKSKQPYEEHIKEYWYYLQRKSPKTISGAISAIKGFLGWKDKQTKTLDIWDTIHIRLKGKIKPVIPKEVPDIDEIRQILHYTDIRTKTCILMRCSSGMRLGEIVKLLPEDINFKETPTRINVRAEIAKNGQRRTTFISLEATNLLKEWLRSREEYTMKSLKSMNFKNRKYLKKQLIKSTRGKTIGLNDDRIFPCSAQSIRSDFNEACEEAGFTNKTEMKGDFDFKTQRKRRHLSSHNLRHFFRTYFGNVDVAEMLMGHSGYLTEYRNFNDKQLAKEYLNYVQNVTVFERTSDLTKVNKSLAEKDKQIQELQKTMEEMKAQITEMRLEKLEKLNGIKK